MNASIAYMVAAAREGKLPHGMTTRIIAIDGCGGSGKSTLAARLAAALGNCTLVHTDDFASWDNAFDWGPRLIAQVLEPLRANKTARYQRYDWEAKELAEWHDVPVSEFAVIEGVSALRPAFRRYISFGVYVEAPRSLRLERGLERDGQEALPLWQGWMAEEDAYVARDMPAAFADLVVKGDARIPD